MINKKYITKRFPKTKEMSEKEFQEMIKFANYMGKTVTQFAQFVLNDLKPDMIKGMSMEAQEFFKVVIPATEKYINWMGKQTDQSLIDAQEKKLS